MTGGRKFCTPSHVVSPDPKSLIRFADAADFLVIANAPGTTAIGLNIWLTNPHPRMPLSPRSGRVIAYILSLRGQRGAGKGFCRYSAHNQDIARERLDEFAQFIGSALVRTAFEHQ